MDFFSFSGEAWLNGGQMPVTDWLTIGAALERETSATVGMIKSFQASSECAARLTELARRARWAS